MQLKLIILFLLLALSLKSQTIPTNWQGKWQGTVNIWAYNSKIDSFPMSLKITPNDTVWDFVISYNRDVDKPDVREYQLIIVDADNNHFAIDEQNSIILDCYFNDNCLYTIFGGMGSDLQTRICLSGQELNYEITSNFSKPIRTSGNEIIEKDTVPEIRSYDLYHLMKAKLVKVE